MRYFVLSVAVGLLVGLAAPAVFGQGTEWEYVGDPYSIYDLYLHDEDMLWAATSDGILRMPPGTDEWVVVQDDRSSDAVVVTESGVILRVRGSSVQRSTDGGENFQTVYTDLPSGTNPLYRVRGGPFAGSLLIGQSKEGLKGAAFSTDDGLTWTEAPIAPDEPFGVPSVFFSIPNAPGEPHAHRILAGAINGIAYSDDGGATWTLSALWETLGYEAYTLAYVAEGPLAGRLYAGVADTSFGRLYYSDDGGVTWTPQREFGGQRFRFVEGADGSEGPSAAGNPGGVLLVVTEGGNVWRSDDGGQAWGRTALPPLAEATGDPWARAQDALLDGEGRLNVAVTTPGPTSEPNGLWRAAFPAVSAEGEPEPGKSGVEVSVYPNPTDGVATVALSLPERADVHLVVYDVLGREVARLFDGAAEAGAHTAVFDTSVLPAGVYIVRVTAGDAVATRWVTVVR